MWFLFEKFIINNIVGKMVWSNILKVFSYGIVCKVEFN